MNSEVKKNKTQKFDLENRLNNYSIRISNIVDSLPDVTLGGYLKAQMIRSGTSPVLNCEEAQSTESTKDFVHKLKIVLIRIKKNISLFKNYKTKTFN